MTPSATSVVVEHLLAGAVALFAVVMAIQPTFLPAPPAGVSLPESLYIMMFLSLSYIIGVIVAHWSARILEATESSIYLSVLVDVATYQLAQVEDALRTL